MYYNTIFKNKTVVYFVDKPREYMLPSPQPNDTWCPFAEKHDENTPFSNPEMEPITLPVLRSSTLASLAPLPPMAINCASGENLAV